MRCGNPGTVVVDHTFSTSPWWVMFFICLGIAPYFMMEFLFRHLYRLRAQVPLCESHQGHFSSRAYAHYGGLVLLILAPLLFFGLDFVKGEEKKPEFKHAFAAQKWEREDYFRAGVAASVAIGLLGACMVAYASLTGIKAYNTTSDGMMVSGVSDEFAKAYEKSFYLDVDQKLAMIREAPWKPEHPFGIEKE